MKKFFTFLLIALSPVYHVMAQTEAATPIDTVDIVCNDMTFNVVAFTETIKMAYIKASNEEYKVTAALEASDFPPGTYTTTQMDLVYRPTNKMIVAATATLTLSVDKNNYCAIKGTMLGENNVLYTLDLSWQAPTAKETIHIAFQQSAIASYYPDLNHDFRLANQNDDYAVVLGVKNVPMGGEFTDKNLNYYLIANKHTADTVNVVSTTGKVWQSNDTTFLTANILGFDSVQYVIEMWYVVPTPTKTVVLNMTNAKFYNYMEKQGYYALVGSNEDQSMEFAISLLGKTEADIPGTYINDGLFGGFTGKNYDYLNTVFEQYATYIATDWNAEKGDYDDLFTIEKGYAKVTMDADKNITLVGTFIGSDAVRYEITMTTKVDVPHLDYDMQEGELDCVINSSDITLQDNTETTYSIFFDILSDKYLMALYFFVEEADPEIVIPEGLYTIDDSEDFYTVKTSDGSYGRNATFLATHDGVYFTSMYFPVSGTVEVKNVNGQLHMEIHALNSYNVPAHIVCNATLTTDLQGAPLQPTDNKVQKCIMDGQLLIMRNGATYNAIGVRVK